MTDRFEHHLAAHAHALRALAAALVGAQHADDLLQDTAVQALQHRDRAVAAPGAWLATVMRFLAHKWRRTERRRSARERAVAGAACRMHAPADAGAEARETFAELTRAVQALPEPYHTTVLLRYLREQTPAEVAAAMQVPLATVRTRLARGLALLRQHFDAYPRQRGRDWRTGMILGVGLHEVAIPKTAFAAGGVVTMSGAKWGFGLLTATLLVAALAWPETGPGPSAPAAMAASAAAATAPLVTTTLKSDVAHVRTEVLLEARNTAAAPIPAQGPQDSIRGRVVDEQRTPLAGILVTLQGHEPEGTSTNAERRYGLWLVARGGRRWVEPTIKTGNDGTFEFVVDATPLRLRLSLQRDGLQHTAWLPEMQQRQELDVGDLVLPRACELHIRVVDEDGRAVPTPRVQIRHGILTGEDPTATQLVSNIEGPAAASGGVLAARVAAGSWRFMVPGRRIVAGEHTEIPTGATAWPHELVVAAAAHRDEIHGLVVDERGGPLADVEVRAWRVTASWACTDRDGRFTLQRGEQPDGEVELLFDKAAYAGPLTPQRLPWGGAEHRCVLREVGGLEVCAVEDATGAPVDHFAVRRWRAADERTGETRNDGARQVSGHHVHGLARVTDAQPGHHVLVVEPHRWDLWRSEPVPVEVAAGATARVEVRLHAAADRELWLRRSNGETVREALVELTDAAAAGAVPAVLSTKFRNLDQWQPSNGSATQILLQQARTGADGKVQLHGPAGRDVVARVTIADRPPFVVGPFQLGGAEPVLATVPIGGTLDLRLGPPEFVAELRAAQSRGRHAGFRLRQGIGRNATLVPTEGGSLVPDAGGRLTIPGAPPGNWQLALEPWDGAGDRLIVWTAAPVAVADIVLRDGETTVTHLDLAHWLPGTIRGVVRCNGIPVANATIHLQIARANPDYARPPVATTSARTDADGRFEYRGRGGDVTVLVQRGERGPSRPRANWVASLGAVVLPPGGVVEHDFAVTSCAVQLRLVDTAGAPVAGVDVTLVRRGAPPHALGQTAADGRVSGDAEPSEFVVQLGPTRTPIGRVTVVTGAPAEVELRVEQNRTR